MDRQISPRSASVVKSSVEVGIRRSKMTEKLLSPPKSEAVESAIEITDIPLEKLTPRSISEYSQDNIVQLAEAIRATDNRLIFPIIVARADELDPNGKVIAKFVLDGVDVSSIEYVIVAGERRWRAFNALKKEEDAKPHGASWINPFSFIPANILTPEEARNEEAYYQFSNIAARRLSSDEAFNIFAKAFKKIQTPEQKLEAMLHMQKSGHTFKTPGRFQKEVVLTEDTDPAYAATLFSSISYCYWYLTHVLDYKETELSENTVKAYINVLTNACEEVLEACCARKYPVFAQARLIVKFSHDKQKKLLDLWLAEDYDGYNAMIFGLSGNTKKEILRQHK